MSGKSSRAGQRWRRRGESVLASLRQYNLSELFVDVLVADSSLRRVWRQGRPLFDAIVTDRQSLTLFRDYYYYYSLCLPLLPTRRILQCGLC